MIITGLITVLTAVSYFFLFPDSPTNAWFLTPEERVMAVKRIKVRRHLADICYRLEQFVSSTGKPNWCRKQAFQEGTVSGLFFVSTLAWFLIEWKE
jgi:hypothetical protein